MNYYNENDPKVADWLRNLVASGLLPEGDVDDRSIETVEASDLVGYKQCHFFAGIGGWSRALMLAGWPDERPVWTGSCPCPPFSAAGKGQRCPQCGSKSNIGHPRKTGHFVCLDCGCDRHADGRHLWPEFGRLIRECGPSTVFGEQVASADGRLWLASVFADLETIGYTACGADLCAAGIGAPQIRQRLWWRADRLADCTGGGWCEERQDKCRCGSGDDQKGRSTGHCVCCADDRLADAELPKVTRQRQYGGQGLHEQEAAGLAGRCLADRMVSGRQCAGMFCGQDDRLADSDGSVERSGEYGLVPQDGGALRGKSCRSQSEPARSLVRPGPYHEFWRDVDWLYGRDGQFRPVEPGTFPLADGVSSRVVRLRAYGNAIVPQVAATFIEASEAP